MLSSLLRMLLNKLSSRHQRHTIGMTYQVRIIQPYIPKYRVPFFEELINQGEKCGISFEVFSGKVPKNLRNRNDSVAIFNKLPSIEFRLSKNFLVKRFLDKSWNNVDLIVAELALRNIETYQLLFRGRRVAFWGHGRTYTKKSSLLKERLQFLLLKRGIWFFSYTEAGKKIAIKEGFEGDRVTVLYNTVDTREVIENSLSLSDHDIYKFERLYEIRGAQICAFIGALEEEKRIPFLLEAAALIKAQVPNFVLLIFGDGSQKGFLLDQIASLDYIKFCGYGSSFEKAMLSHVAKALLIPGRVGLIAVDSFAMGVPIITTDWPFHAPEFEFLNHGHNSMISPNELDQYAEIVVSLLTSNPTQQKLREGCKLSSQDFSIENMVKLFIDGTMQAINGPDNAQLI